MKLLVFTDTHSSDEAEKEVIAKAQKEQPDIMLCCGDFTIFGSQPKRFLKKMNALKIPLYLIHGNHEDEDEIAMLSEKYKYVEFMHNKAVRHDNLLIMGYGGDGFSLEDPFFDIVAKVFEKKIKEHSETTKILMLHQPPHKSHIDVIYGEHAGNKSTKRFIVKNKLQFVFAGHLHENSGVKHKTKHTHYINPGPYGEIIEIE